jgi:hypothetical protein
VNEQKEMMKYIPWLILSVVICAQAWRSDSDPTAAFWCCSSSCTDGRPRRPWVV